MHPFSGEIEQAEEGSGDGEVDEAETLIQQGVMTRAEPFYMFIGDTGPYRGPIHGAGGQAPAHYMITSKPRPMGLQSIKPSRLATVIFP